MAMSRQILRAALAGATLMLTTLAPAGPTTLWLEAADGAAIRGDLYALEGDDNRSAPVILLFHQAGSNRGEYAEIAPRLNGMGFHALAIDQRSGGKRWGYENETVEKLGGSTDYIEALADLEAALKWKTESRFSGKTLVWGSSYSASLVFLLAAKHPEIDAVLSFSPGEYLATRKDEVRQAARGVKQPVLVLTPGDERGRAEPVVEAIAGGDKRLVIPERAVHGSSMLVAERNEGAAAIWPDVQAFLERFKG
jgi:dienelactone hydrolase